MLFSSITFLYYFLPCLLFLYFLVPKKYKNVVLLSFSLLFYFLGEPRYIIILVGSCLFNYYFAKKIAENKYRKQWLIIACIYNVGQLLYFKYTDFFIQNINAIFEIKITYLYIIMPIGISFFTFQALGYVVDVYNHKHEPSKSLLDFMTYISLFPQLVAGPIVRYSTIEDELQHRQCNGTTFANGITRFICGLGKKVLIANVLGEISGKLIVVDFVASWLKPILFSLQIYFDFSGYSDMAIGLGLMFGFHFLENFNYPFIASSISDFWRRWHISLSSWFKDYVYIPLGGNKGSKWKQIRNIAIVWFLTGFWHGASWNFILWGVYFAVLLILEKFVLKKYLDRSRYLKYVYTLFLVVISFLIFNSSNVMEIVDGLKVMFGITPSIFISKTTSYYLGSNALFLVMAIISATPLMKNLFDRLQQSKYKKVVDTIQVVGCMLCLLLVTSFLIDESFNPFLYFRF